MCRDLWLWAMVRVYNTKSFFVKSTRSRRGSQLGVGLTGVYNSGPKTAGGPQRKNSNLTIYRAIWRLGHYLRIIPAPRVYLLWDNAPFWYYLAVSPKTRLWSTIITDNNQHQVTQLIPIIGNGQHKSSKTTCGKSIRDKQLKFYGHVLLKEIEYCENWIHLMLFQLLQLTTYI